MRSKLYESSQRRGYRREQRAASATIPPLYITTSTFLAVTILSVTKGTSFASAFTTCLSPSSLSSSSSSVALSSSSSLSFWKRKQQQLPQCQEITRGKKKLGKDVAFPSTITTVASSSALYSTMTDEDLETEILFTTTDKTTTTARTKATTSTTTRSNGKKKKRKNNNDETATAAATTTTTRTPLSEIDARVLQSILQDETLDLKTEENLQKLLERGVATTATEKGEEEEEEATTRNQKKKKTKSVGSGRYSSTVIKTVSSFDNVFWNSLRAKTNEILESARIFLANRIERDSKLLASVGLFALERAKRDVTRALPSSGRSGAAVGRAMRRAVRNSAAKSSFQEYIPQDSFILGPAKEEGYGNGRKSVYDELNTPMDEIRSVTETIRDILSGKSTEYDYESRFRRTKTRTSNGESSSGIGGRGLRSVAPAGQSRNAERQRRAYQRRRDTVFKRERERVDEKIGRAVGAVTDAAWEMKREMEVETNRPGYRSEAVRAAIEGTAAKALLEAERSGGGRWAQLPLGIGKRLFGWAADRAVDVLELKEAQAAEEMKVRVPTLEDLLDERARLAAGIRICLEQPDQTWLVPSVLERSDNDEKENVVINDEALGEVITAMICARDDLEADDEEENFEIRYDSTQLIIEELRRMKGTIEMITSRAALAAGYDAAARLSSELYGTTNGYDADSSILKFVDEIEEHWKKSKVKGADRKGAAVNGSANTRPKNGKRTARRDVTMADAVTAQVMDAIVVPEIVTVGTNGVDSAAQPVRNGKHSSSSSSQVPDPNLAYFAAYADSDVSAATETMDDVELEKLPLAEIVTDDDFEDAFINVKATKALSEDEQSMDEVEKEEKESLLVVVTLRTLDVFFFVAEKMLTVAIPELFKAGKNVAMRIAMLRQAGMGSKGWKLLNNVQDGAKRY